MPLKFLLKQENDKIIIENNDKNITWQQLKNTISASQALLLNKNAKSCALFSHDAHQFIATFLGCIYLGIDIFLAPNNSKEMEKKLQADVYIGDFHANEPLPLSTNAIQHNNKTSHIVFFTSGSGGEPKKIKRKLSQLLSEIEQSSKLWQKLINKSLFASSVSYQHIYGLLFSILLPLVNKRMIWHHPLPFEESLQRLVAEQKNTVLVSSPAFLKRLTLTLDEQHGEKLKVFCSGGLLSQTQHQATEQRLNCEVIQVYGSTETGGIAFRSTAHRWQFMPLVKHKINNNSLWVKSPMCYTDQWIDTQDKIKLEADGFDLLGRKDRIVKIEEKRIALAEVEHFIKQNDNIKETYTICINEHRQYIAAIITLSTQGKKLLQETSEKAVKLHLKSFLKDKIEPLAMPRKIRILAEIPCNSQGKKVYNDILKIFNP